MASKDTLSHGVLALAGATFVITASCAHAPKQPDPGHGYTLETTGAVIGRDVPQQRNEPDPTVGEVATRLSGQICEREARCHGGGPVSAQCLRVFPSGAVLAQGWRGPAPRSLDYDAAVAALDAINLKPCAAKAIDEGIAQSQQPDQPELRERPRTNAHIIVTFAPDGGVLTSKLDSGPDGSAVDLSGTAAGQCVVERFRKARVPTFDGDPWNVGVAFLLD
jgi:hypothetical protein